VNAPPRLRVMQEAGNRTFLLTIVDLHG
jgi:hypothetical protein